MIDALAAVIKRFSGDSTVTSLCGTRIAPKHKFGNQTIGDSWQKPAKAIEISYDPGGTPDIYLEVQNVRLKATCYGEDEYQASRVYAALVGVARSSNRVVVTTSNGQALIYWILLDGTPEQQFNVDLDMPLVQVYLTANVAESAVS